MKTVTHQTLVQIPALRSISGEQSFLSHTGNLFKCPQVTGRNPMTFLSTDSPTIPASTPGLQHLCCQLPHNLITAASRLGLQANLLAIHHTQNIYVIS